MEPQVSATFARELAAVVALYQQLGSRARRDDLRGVQTVDIQRLTAMARAAIGRVAGEQSQYAKHADRILEGGMYDAGKAVQLVGGVQALLADVQAGRLAGIGQLVRGELFGDFLEMARYLLDEGYKDPAAVIAGSALEAHLRVLCQNASIDTEVASAGEVRRKKADRLNAELTKADVYSKLDQKNVTAWLDLRNKAAHGEYDQYTKEQVSLMVDGIRDFFTRHPS